MARWRKRPAGRRLRHRPRHDRDHLPRHLGDDVCRQRRCRGGSDPAARPTGRSPPSPGTSRRRCCACPTGCGIRANSSAAGRRATLRGAVAAILARRRAGGPGGRRPAGAPGARAGPRDRRSRCRRSSSIDNLVTFLAAGHETTAKALTWTLYLLARAPEWQERILARDRRVVGDGRHRARSTSTASRHARGAEGGDAPLSAGARHDAAGGRGRDARRQTIKAGTLIVIPIFAVHRHRKLWDDPDRFDPERFAPEREAKYRAHAVHAVRLRAAHLHRRHRSP